MHTWSPSETWLKHVISALVCWWVTLYFETVLFFFVWRKERFAQGQSRLWLLWLWLGCDLHKGPWRLCQWCHVKERQTNLLWNAHQFQHSQSSSRLWSHCKHNSQKVTVKLSDPTFPWRCGTTKVKMKALGTCKLLLENPKTSKKYMVQRSWEYESDHRQLWQVLECKWSRWRRTWYLTRLFWYVQWRSWHLAWLCASDHETQCRAGPSPPPPTPRKSYLLQDQVKQELDRLVNVGVLTLVDELTDWVNQMVIATKKDGRSA